MKYLSRQMDTVNSDLVFQFHHRCKKLSISHLMFANDLLLFSKADLQSIQVLYAKFKAFAMASGLKFNASKLAIYIASVNVGIFGCNKSVPPYAYCFPPFQISWGSPFF